MGTYKVKNPVYGVPVSFLDRYNLEQFEIIGIANNIRYIGDFECYTIINDKPIYNRILIKKKPVKKRDNEKNLKQMKDCLLIANSNACTYKEVFPLIKNKQLRWGYNWVKTFTDKDGNETPFGNICWFTSLPATNKRKLVLTQSYDPKKYPKYDNYDAIEVGRIKDIPYDYEGVMGVPITIFGYDLENVEIKGMAAGNSAANGFGKDAEYSKHKKDRGGCPVIDDERIYTRILIKNFEVIDLPSPRPIEGGDTKYARVLIKNQRTTNGK